MDTLTPLLPISLVGVAAIFLLTRSTPPSEQHWLRRVLLVALVARALVAVVFSEIPETRLFHEDAEGYEYVGTLIAKSWLGVGPPVDFLATHSQNFGYYVICAASNYVFGMYRVVPSLVNVVVGTITVFFVYRLARTFFQPLVAKRATLFAAFFPSMVLWSAVALKDTVVTLLILLALSSCVALRRRFTVGALVGTVLPIVATLPIRFYMLYFLSFAIFASLLAERGMRSLSGISKVLALALFIGGLLVMVGVGARAEQGVEYLSFEKVSSFRKGMANTANSGFSNDVDISTLGGVLTFLPVGVATLLLSPFPWQFTSLRALLAAPETIYWWLLLPALWRGLRLAIKHVFAQTSPILFFSLVLTLGYSLMHGNVGSGFRQRAQIFVFLFIFAALGIYEKRCRQRGIDPALLLVDAGAPAQ